jgi:hypothetical protein
MILAHLVGEQTTPNLLAILALRPSKVLQISSHGRFKASARNLERSLTACSLVCDCRTLELASASPPPDEIGAALAALEPDWKPTLFNLTGGTKLMSFGAHTWAVSAGVPCLYVDTESQRFLSLGELPLPPLPPLPEIAARLTLPIVLTAHGVPTGSLDGEAPTPAECEFGRAAAIAWEKIEPCDNWVKSLKDAWLTVKGELAGDKYVQGFNAPKAPSAMALVHAAAAVGWCRVDRHRVVHADMSPDVRADRDRRRLFIKDLVKNLEGGWFELLLAGQMLASAHFQDVRWSVESRERHDLGLGENDIVALDRRRLAPVFVSCKRSSSFEKPLEHIFALRQRATHFGGAFAAAVLCVAWVNLPDEEKRLSDFTRSANVRLLIGTDACTHWIAG